MRERPESIRALRADSSVGGPARGSPRQFDLLNPLLKPSDESFWRTNVPFCFGPPSRVDAKYLPPRFVALRWPSNSICMESLTTTNEKFKPLAVPRKEPLPNSGGCTSMQPRI